MAKKNETEKPVVDQVADPAPAPSITITVDTDDPDRFSTALAKTAQAALDNPQRFAMTVGGPVAFDGSVAREPPPLRALGIIKVDVDENGEGHLYLEANERLHVHLPNGRVVTHTS